MHQSWIIALLFPLLSICYFMPEAKTTESTKTETPKPNTVEIFVPNGPIVGEKYFAHNRNLIRFLGIPYAQPPVGKLRFRNPVPVSKNIEPIQALEWPNNCIQSVFSEFGKYLNNNFSEDCLYLNIWSPDVNVNEQNLRPVIVYIYGGGLIMGSSSMDVYNGETLAAMADSVVVTFNYRLSTLGFLYSTEVDNVKGNQGLWDQALAIKWVNENIRYFGGNPKQITLMGQSAGSWSVSAHILSPITRDLFQNAVMLSGAVANLLVVDPQKITKIMLNGIRQIECATKQDTTISAKVIECLEQKDVQSLLNVMFLAKNNDLLDLPEIVVADGQFLPERPQEAMANGNHKKQINILISTVEDEGSNILTMVNDTRFRVHNPDKITLAEAKDGLADILENHVLKQPIEKEPMNNIYFSGFNDNFDCQDLFRKQVGIAFGDMLLTCPTIDFANNIFRNSPESVTVYQLYYAAKIGSEKFLCSDWMGSCHGTELYPLFGIPFRDPQKFHNRERQISEEIINILKSFIRTGKPDTNQPEWLPYFMANNDTELVAPYYEINNEMKSFRNFKFNLKQTECRSIWSKYSR